MAGILNAIRARCVGFLRNTCGAVAVETALVAGLLTILIAQVLDFGWFAYCSMQTKTAAQAAAAKAAAVCKDAAQLPATQNCSNLQQVMEDAAQKITNSTAVTVTALNEGYYCQDPGANNAFVEVGDIANNVKPADCSPYSATATPGDYINVTVTYNFTPMFPGLSAISYSGNTLTADGWMRLG